MNQKFALAAIAMFAVIMGIGMVAPAMAAPNDNASDKAKNKPHKVSICHWQEPETEVDDAGNEVIVEDGKWKVINVSKNAQKAHVDKHTDGEEFDTVVDDSDAPVDGSITSEECENRNIETDVDGDEYHTDGTGLGLDCNDNDATINPGVDEIPGNEVDENCDGVAEPAPAPEPPTGTTETEGV